MFAYFAENIYIYQGFIQDFFLGGQGGGGNMHASGEPPIIAAL